ncbi:hypothetical protein DI09_46p60 [Mitosporidium daphniae]|uniref:Uncharacterized protein n=1 Tax=Mitosporidium daphniae TaxID=1485682 RepID=A0A098VTK6_9MICR|nr:uncharacterized protein DI09_46p60 [Mitosporidium daphniae]KGG51056.1 hypothetical protein DI09_46p60 [Mitosporidium daphniae]|eukprot:XP_013237502.1 uncharacterized protein DI09_46p60 [Mitosporidium daphniae]
MKLRFAALTTVLAAAVTIVLVYTLKGYFDSSFDEASELSNNIKASFLPDSLALSRLKTSGKQDLKDTLCLGTASSNYKEHPSKKPFFIMGSGIAIVTLSALLIHILQSDEPANSAQDHNYILAYGFLILLAIHFFTPLLNILIFGRKNLVFDHKLLVRIYLERYYGFIEAMKKLEPSNPNSNRPKINIPNLFDGVNVLETYITIFPNTTQLFPDPLSFSDTASPETLKLIKNFPPNLVYNILQDSTFKNHSFPEKFTGYRPIGDAQSYQFYFVIIYDDLKYYPIINLHVNDMVNSFLYNCSLDTLLNPEERFMPIINGTNTDMLKEAQNSLKILQSRTSEAIALSLTFPKNTTEIKKLYDSAEFVAARNYLKRFLTKGPISYNIQRILFRNPLPQYYPYSRLELNLIAPEEESVIKNLPGISLERVRNRRGINPEKAINLQRHEPGNDQGSAINLQRHEPGNGQGSAISLQRHEPGNGQGSAISLQRHEPGNGQGSAISLQRNEPGNGQGSAINLQRHEPGNGQGSAISLQRNEPGKGQESAGSESAKGQESAGNKSGKSQESAGSDSGKGQESVINLPRKDQPIARPTKAGANIQ